MKPSTIHRKLFQSFALALLAMMITGKADAVTICSGSCGIYTESRQYTYDGYLSELAIASSQVLPLNAGQFYNALGLVPGSSKGLPTTRIKATIHRVDQ